MKVYIMIGLIGSGKSSWAKMTAGTDFNTIRVSCDDIRDMIKDRYTFDLQLEPLVRKISTAMIALVLLEGKNVVIDDCHLMIKHRQELCATIKEVAPEVEIIYVWVQAELDVALRRRLVNLRGRTEFEWRHVMKKMVDVFEPPDCSECGVGVVNKIIEVNNG